MQPAQSVEVCARASLLLAAAFDSPLERIVRALTREPRAAEIVVDGVPTSVHAPGAGAAWPALVMLNGATERGRFHPRVVRLARAFARAGHLVLVPDIPGIARGVVTRRGVHATVACAVEAASRAGAPRGRMALLGISVGTPLALLAAEEPNLRSRVSVVAGLTGYTDLVDLIRLATTGTYREAGELRKYTVGPFLSLCIARSLCADLDDGRDKARLTAAIDVADDDPDPLAGLARLAVSGMDGDARAALALLCNRDPARFDELYAQLSGTMREHIERLSPLVSAERLRARVELLVDPQDKYFPLEHARALERASPRVRVTTTGLLAHADARFTLGRASDAAQLVGFVARTLQAARFG